MIKLDFYSYFYNSFYRCILSYGVIVYNLFKLFIYFTENWLSPGHLGKIVISYVTY